VASELLDGFVAYASWDGLLIHNLSWQNDGAVRRAADNGLSAVAGVENDEGCEHFGDCLQLSYGGGGNGRGLRGKQRDQTDNHPLRLQWHRDCRVPVQALCDRRPCS
jgi:hypothetical protein